MKKKLECFVILLVCLSICCTQVKAEEAVGYTCKTISVSEKYSDTKSQNSYKKIIRTYKDLVKLKKYIKKNYNSPKKYLNKLNKYKKSYFKKKALVFVTENVDMNSKSYKFVSAVKENGKLNFNIERLSLLKEGQSTTCEVIYGAKTYILEVKKTKIKKIKKVRIVYHDIKQE
jgi:hypothetical protein